MNVLLHSYLLKYLGSILKLYNIYQMSEQKVQKVVTFSEIKGKFTKDFASIDKMDVFLEFAVGNCVARTETAQGIETVSLQAGKELVWKEDVVLTYFDQNQIIAKAYHEGITKIEFIGSCPLQIKELKIPGSSIMFPVLADNGKNMGSITGRYTVKNRHQSPLSLLKNFKFELVKESKLFLKVRPYLQFTVDEICMATEPKDEVLGTSITWGESLRLKIKENSKITIELFDKDDTSSHIFQYECSAKEFRLTNGSKRFHVHDKKYNQLGLLCFDFETVSLVSAKHAGIIQREKTGRERHHSLKLNKSKKSLLSLPSIKASSHQRSSTTLRRGTVAYSIPKGDRFANDSKYTGEPIYYLYSCFKLSPTKGAGIGFGEKKPYPDWMERNMIQNPAPGYYSNDNYGLISKGPGSGIGYKNQQWVMIPREQKPLQNSLAKSTYNIKLKLSLVKDFH